MNKIIGHPIYLLVILCFMNLPAFGQSAKDTWVDSVFQSLSTRQRIAQLFMVAAYSAPNQAQHEALYSLVENEGIGGVIFFKGGPVAQALLTNQLQQKSKLPLFIAMDAEWGVKMRLDSVSRFPYQMTLAAIQNEDLIYETGKLMANQCRRLGVHINFAPVVDVNNNPDNPVISFRSFGEVPKDVARKSAMIMAGMQDHGVMAVAKHFPGHGDTDIDSHLDLPTISHDRKRLETVELIPFKELIDKKVGGMMIAHLNVPALDSSGVPASLSSAIVNRLLKADLGFNGLVFTDALNMKGVTKNYEVGDIEIMALQAGNDVLLFSEDVPKAIQAVENAVHSNLLSQKLIEEKCRKILASKYDFGLTTKPTIEVENLVNDLNTLEDDILLEKLAQGSATVLKNENILPIADLFNKRIAVVSIGVNDATEFQKVAARYTLTDNYFLPKDADDSTIASLWMDLLPYDYIIAGVHNMAVYPANHFGISMGNRIFLGQLAKSEKAILTVFGNPYALAVLDDIEKAKGLILAYQETNHTQSVAAQAIFGGISINGKLPVSSGKFFSNGMGIELKSIDRFGYLKPESVGLNSFTLQKIDTVVTQAIRAGAIPGCQILVAKNQKVVYNKSFGYHTYDSLNLVKESDVYDLASITKVSASTTALMKLYDQGLFNLDAKPGDYLSDFKRGNKVDVTFREMLTHQAGLKAWIPFWQNTVRKSGKFKYRTFKADSSKRYNVKVTDQMYLHHKYGKKIYRQIRKSPMGEKNYVYSDLSFYLYPKIVEQITGQRFEDYIKEELFHPLGAYSLTYNPLRFYSKDAIVPTEYDSLFRKGLIHGSVHDEGATMIHGVSGHAGLFGNATDLAKLFQMLSNQGKYGGKEYFSTATVEEFTRCQYCDQGNRRALGFDRPLENPHKNGNTAVDVSQQSFGHTGFTGTFVWVDPTYDIVYVFLSNRVYPTRNNTMLYKLNVRTNIQQIIYDAMFDNED